MPMRLMGEYPRMILKQMATRGQAGPSQEALIPIGERCMALLLEGASGNVPALGYQTYREFRLNVERLSLQIPDITSDEDKLLLTRTIIHEFENYNAGAKSAVRETLAAWQALVTLLFGELLDAYDARSSSKTGAMMAARIGMLATTEEIHEWHDMLEKLLRSLRVKSQEGDPDSPLRQLNQSKANDNAAGLPGGGSAMEHVQKLMDEGGEGYVVFFQLRCMDVISQRFGMEAVQDCLMAVSAFLTAGLDNHDKIYHWSDSTLLAVLQGRPSEAILTAEIQRILSQNRESTIHVAGRPIMLRIPLAFDVIPVNRLNTPEDLLRLSERKPNT